MWESLFQRVLDMSLTASVAIVVVLAARLLLRRAPKIFSYALWAIVLFRLCCPVAVTSELSLFGMIEKAASKISVESDGGLALDFQEDLPAARQDGDLVSESEGSKDSTAEQSDSVGLSGSAEQMGAAVQSGLTGKSEQSADTGAAGKNSLLAGETLLGMAAYVWGAGILVMGMYSLISLLRVRRSLVGAVPLRDNIYVCDYIQSPFVMGVFRPRIYLCSALKESEMEYIILHEQHHIRRYDHLIKIAAFAALCIHWFNPLVWVAFILAGKDMEMSCDEAVVAKLGERIRWEYSQSLLSLSTGHRMITGAPLAFGEGSTKGRIRNLLKKKKAGKWLMGLAVVVLLAAGVILLTDPAGASQADSVTDEGTMNQTLSETQDMAGESEAENTEEQTAAQEQSQPVSETQDVTGQGFLGAKGEPYIMEGELVTIPIHFNTLKDGETARVTVEYGAFERIIHDSGQNLVDKHWLEPDEKLENGDALLWYQSDDDVKLCYGTVWGYALIEEEEQITGYAVFLLDVPKRGWSGSEIVREVRFDEAMTEAQVLEEINQVIEEYTANNEVLECVTESVEETAGESGSAEEETEMVRFEMVERVYDIELAYMEELSDGQYVLGGKKYYPDIVLTDEQREQLDQVGLLCGFFDGEEKFRITKKSGLYWFKWGEEKEYAVQFLLRDLPNGEEGWLMGMRPADSPIGGHCYGPLADEFEITVLADQVIVADGVTTRWSWGITAETLTAEEFYEAYTLHPESHVRLRVYEEGENPEIVMIYRA